MSPDGRRVEFQVLQGQTLVTPLSVIDRKTGTIDRVATEYSPATPDAAPVRVADGVFATWSPS